MINPLGLSLIMLTVVFGGALVGLWLQGVLPEHHLAAETKEAVRLATALIATLTALVLSLLVSSAKNSFDQFDEELTQNAARVVMLDRTLAEYGAETAELRAVLKSSFARRIELLFPSDPAAQRAVAGPASIPREESIDTRLLALVPAGPVQQGLQTRAVELNTEINMTRALIHAQRRDSIPVELLLVLGVWLTIIFATFGLFAPRNMVVVGTLFACAMSASGAVFLLLEMYSPFDGLLNLSSAAMRDALALLGQ
jgi:hypothetical protein